MLFLGVRVFLSRKTLACMTRFGVIEMDLAKIFEYWTTDFSSIACL